MRKRILALSYYFPPMAAPRSIQVSRLLSGLDASVFLVCGKDTIETIDETIPVSDPGRYEMVYKIPFHKNKYKRYSDYASRRMGLSFSDMPDEKRGWAKRAARETASLLPASDIRAMTLITFGQPMSDHLAGLELKKKYGLPWIAHFSDPWFDSPFRNDNYFTGNINYSLEREVIKNSDITIFTSEETSELVMSKYPASWKDKAVYLPHCYDRELIESITPDKNSEYTFRSIGNFYGNRTPEPFYRAVETIARSEPGILNDVRIEFYGYFEKRLKSLLDSYPQAGKHIHYHGTVPYMDGLKLAAGADCLLAIDAPSEYSIFFPSKLVDYAGTGKYIFAITPRGTTANIVNKAGGETANPADIGTVTSVLTDILKTRPRAVPNRLVEFEKNVVCGKMMDILNSLS
ncbi:MAG TPA: hypothetical protein PLN69_09930 [bacterium]|nr:hypothetical protein [bacterium]